MSRIITSIAADLRGYSNNPALLTDRVYFPCRLTTVSVSFCTCRIVLFCYIRIATCVACTCRYGSPSSYALERFLDEYRIFV